MAFMFGDIETSTSKRAMTEPGKKALRLFRYAIMRGHTRDHAFLRGSTPIIAEFSTAFSVAYTLFRANAARHDLAITPVSVEDAKKRARRVARIFVDRRAGTDLHTVRQSRSAPFASGRLLGAAGGAGVLRGRSEDDEATGEAHFLMPKGDVL